MKTTKAAKLGKGDYVTELMDEVTEVLLVTDFEITLRTRNTVVQLPVDLEVTTHPASPDATERDLGPCRWFLGCQNEATHLQHHPILGDVPICDRCRAKYDAS